MKASEPVFPIRQLLSTDNDTEALTIAREQIRERPGTTTFAGKSGVWIAGPDELTLEIITEELRKRLPSKMTLGRLTIDYRETISRTIEIEGKEIPTGRVDGRFWYGHVWLKLEPVEEETKITFVDAIRGGTVPTEFIPAVEAGIRNALLEGPVSGFPVAGIRATLFDGSYHDIDSSEEAFFKAAFTACKKGLLKAKPVIFEPIMFVEMRTPEFCVGNIIGDLSGRRGLIVGQDEIGGILVIRARVPLSEMFGYSTGLRTLSHAMASYSMKFDCFEKAPTMGPDDDEPKSMVMRVA